MPLATLLLEQLQQTQFWISIFVCFVLAYVVQFYLNVRKLPPGPFPLPFIGNILQLRGPKPMYEKAIIWAKHYGDPITLWVGPRLFIIVNTKENFKDVSGPFRNVLGGRITMNVSELHKRGYDDIIFSDFGPAWDVLRRLAHVAIRKYAQTEKLAELVARVSDAETERLFKQQNEINYEITSYVERIVDNILAVSNFGEGFRIGDPDYDEMKESTKYLEDELPNGLPSDILPILGWIFHKKEREAKEKFENIFRVSDRMFEQAFKSWTPGKVRHFTDVLLNFREEFVKEDRASAKYLKNENIRQVIFDIFSAGTGTSRTILSFSYLRLAYHDELQEELRNEIKEQLGEHNTCYASDRNKLPKLDSFLQEIIRFYTPVPFGVPRKAMADVTLNGRLIPKGSAILLNLRGVNLDKEIWGPDAEEFKPLRFMSPSKDQISTGANSFGIGSRSCPGEKMAQSDMFYALVRTLQKIRLSCPLGPGTANLNSIDSDIQMNPLRQDLVFTKLQ